MGESISWELHQPAVGLEDLHEVALVAPHRLAQQHRGHAAPLVAEQVRAACIAAGEEPVDLAQQLGERAQAAEERALGLGLEGGVGERRSPQRKSEPPKWSTQKVASSRSRTRALSSTSRPKLSVAAPADSCRRARTSNGKQGRARWPPSTVLEMA
jgi:hypothetical protein